MNRLLYLCLIPLTAASNAISIQPVHWGVVGGNRPRPVLAGRSVNVTLQAEIAKGWHIYSLSQKSGGPIPLRLRLAGAADVSIRGAIQAPKPESRFDKNFGIETEVYSGSPRFTIPLSVPRGSLTGKRSLQVEARYQVCSATLCLPPRTEKLEVTLQITRRK